MTLKRRMRGVRARIPQGYVLGRVDPGDGEVQPVQADDLVRAGVFGSAVKSDSTDFDAAGAAAAALVTAEAYTDAAVAAAGTNSKTMTAAANLNGNFFVKADSSGHAAVPSLAVLADGIAVIGITTGAIASGASGPVQTGGVMVEPSWSWTPGGAIYVGASGLPTQIVPSGKWVLQGGVAIDLHTIEITLGPVISTPL